MSSPGARPRWLAAASGLVLGAAFLPGVPGVLAWFAFVPLLLALEQRVAEGGPKSWFTLGLWAGACFFLVGTHWIALLNDVALTIGWLKYVGWVAGAAYLALYWGAATWLAGVLARRSGLPARWTFAPAMLWAEELRGSGDLGFPWFQPGYTQHALPTLQLASLGGVTLVTLWVLLANAACAQLVRRRTPAAWSTALLLFALPLGWGAWSLRARVQPAGPEVALVQGNIPGEIKWAGKQQQAILDAFVALTDSASSTRQLKLVIWPETATGSYLRRDPAQSVQVAQAAARAGAPVLSGFAHWMYDAQGRARPYNAAGAWNPDGSLTAWYGKRHLVPFGERVPFQRWFPGLSKWDLGQAEWEPGPRPVLLPGPGGPNDSLAVLICFESIFPDLAREDVRAGARVLVNITNDEWFGNGAALQQHAAMAPFRAVEHRVPLLRCANTGITAVIDAWGVWTARLPVFVPGVLVAPLPPAGPATPYTALGDWPGALAMLAALAMACVPFVRRVRRRDR